MEAIQIGGLIIYYDRIYRRIKVPRLEFEKGRLSVILPLGYKNERKLIERHARWIKNRHESFREIGEISRNLVIPQPMDIDAFRNFIEGKARAFSRELGVEAGEVVSRKLKSRWGSCTGRGKITVNSILRFLPEKLIEYIIFHETAHLVEKKHNKRFYAIIKRKFQDTEKIEKELSAYWHILFPRSPE